MIWKARIWRLSWILWSEKKDIVGWSGRSKFSSKKWGKINEIHRKSIKIGAKNGNRVYLNSSRLIEQWFGNITWQTVARETMKFYKKTWSNPKTAESVVSKWFWSLKLCCQLLTPPKPKLRFFVQKIAFFGSHRFPECILSIGTGIWCFWTINVMVSRL